MGVRDPVEDIEENGEILKHPIIFLTFKQLLGQRMTFPTVGDKLLG